MVEPKKLAIIDGKSVFYRGYYAMPNLSMADGTPTGGVFGFASMALEVIRRLKPDYVAVAWDKSGTNIRKRLEMYPAYKAGRKPAPPDFKIQIPLLHDLLQAFGWPLYEMDDYEADDIMGTLAVQAAKKDIETMLITSDLDMLQLVDPRVHVFALKKGLSNIELYSPKSFEAKYGIKATQFLDLKALKGDSSDNIPGVPGIGEKTAIELLKQFKTLDGIYDNLALIKDSARKKLEAGRELAYLSKKLGAIWTDAPIKLNLKEVDGSTCDPLRLRDTLQKLEFRSLVRQLPEAMQVTDESRSSPENKANLDVDKALNATVSRLKRVAGSDQDMIVYARAAGAQGEGPELLIVSPEKGLVITTTFARASAKTEIAAQLRQAITKGGLIGYDTKSVLKIFLDAGVDPPKVKHDVMIGAFLINSLRREQTLSELARSELGSEGGDLESLSPEGLAQQAGKITATIRALYEKQTAELAKLPKIQKLASAIEWPLIPVLAGMEHVGIRLDAAQLESLSGKITDLVSDLEQQIYGHADQEFNIGSPGQLADILFDKLQLPTTGIKRGKTGYSTAASELDKLRLTHPIVNLISQWREVTKLKNTYVDTLPKLIDERSRLHTTYDLTTAQTGRLSSHDPNLQNIPVRSDMGRQIRSAFVAGPGNLLVSADYSQFELRLAAYLSNDQDLIDMFNQDVDVHLATAAEIYEREPEDVTKNMRREAKVVNFGIMYGLSTHGLVVATGMTYERAQHFIKRYFEIRPKLVEYIAAVKEQARRDGYVETIFGRRRPTPDVHSSNFAVREAAMRAAVNMPFQGSAADIMKLAMVKVQENFDQLKTQDSSIKAEQPQLLLQIHDSVIVEVSEAEAEKTAELLKTTMENAHKLSVKLTVDTYVGQNWGEL